MNRSEISSALFLTSLQGRHKLLSGLVDVAPGHEPPAQGLRGGRDGVVTTSPAGILRPAVPTSELNMYPIKAPEKKSV